MDHISTHAPLAGRDNSIPASIPHTAPFQPTRPLRGATAAARPSTPARTYFNPRAPCGARLRLYGAASRAADFNPRAPCGARLRLSQIKPASSIFQPTRPLRGATVTTSDLLGEQNISTHAPLAGRDELVQHDLRALGHFNPRAPCGARPLAGGHLRPQDGISTHAPLAGRDACRRPSSTSRWNFNPRAPCGARQPPRA